MRADEALRALGSRPEGLSSEEARLRLDRFGPNRIRETRRDSALRIFARQFQSPLIYILLIAGAVTLALREYVDAIVIGAVLVLNAVIGFVQERGAERSIAALRRLARARALVVRDGREHLIDAAEVVPGDVLLVEAGTKVAADGRVLHAVSLEADESALTGESVPVRKSPESVDPDAALGDRHDMLHTGTVLTRGRGRALVVATGADTQLGAIAGSLERVGRVETPLERRMGRFARIVAIAVLASCALGLVVGLSLGEDPGPLFLGLVALAVAAIPEGLPIVLTVALAISVRRMAARRTLVRRLSALETLGSCSAIGSDKTGTLTENRMTVQRIWSGGRGYEVTGHGHAAGGELVADDRVVAVPTGSPLHLTLLAGVLCNDASAVESEGEMEVQGDPTEVALLISGAKAGLDKDELEDRLPRAGEIPFDSEARFSATLNRDEGGGPELLFVKGAPEVVVDMCERDAAAGGLDRDEVLARAHELASSGLRVLAFAYRPVEPGGDGLTPAGLTFLGLQGMLDPPREEAVAAVAACQQAGIRVLMITGDHASTAAGIAQRVGIAGPGARVLTGRDLDRLDDEGLAEEVRRVSVFARVSPEHKLRIVQALRATGETVAVTGDGVNDAPALRAADVGAAMGRTGTDVAKEAADIVIVDDDFATVVAAVEEGRIAFDNVRKTTFFLISTGVAAIIAVLASIFAGFPVPFLPLQMIWLNVVTNGVQDVALAFEPGEKGVLHRPPRAREEGLISPMLWTRTALAGAVMAAGTLLLFLIELEVRDAGIDRARTVALTTMVLFQAFHLGNCRSEDLSAFAKSPVSNRFLFVAAAVHKLLRARARRGAGAIATS
jgi:Ca2+-transporting ATPase